MDKIQGKVWKFGDNIDTDVIIPARYLNMTDPADLAAHLFEPVRGEHFDEIVNGGDIVVGGDNFGCGSSREHAPIAIKASGISCVIAKTFARIFYRNAFNIGLPVVESPEAFDGIEDGHIVDADLVKGEIRNETTGGVFKASAIPPFMQRIIDDGGLMPHIAKRRS